MSEIGEDTASAVAKVAGLAREIGLELDRLYVAAKMADWGTVATVVALLLAGSAVITATGMWIEGRRSRRPVSADVRPARGDLNYLDRANRAGPYATGQTGLGQRPKMKRPAVRPLPLP